MSERLQVLVVDDERNMRIMLQAQLERWGYDVLSAKDGKEALSFLQEHHVDIVLTDLRMPGMDGMALLDAVLQRLPDTPVIMITAHGTVDTAVEAIKKGAFDFITKPYDRAALKEIVGKAAKTCVLRRNEYGGDDYGGDDASAASGRFRIIGCSPRMLEIYDMVERVAPTPSTVLISGESGTGKELIARAIYENSSRRDQPFIRVNCAAIPPTLIESELFGYEKGAFTGAETSKPGRFELADKGTLFLDEVGEISLEMQVKLLRALQEGEFERVGAVATTQVDVRLIAATNQDLRQAVKEGKFREDLFYRLNVVHIHLPPLRERTEDIPLLADHFQKRFNERLGKNVRGFDEAAMARLLTYRWPGNIRELENVIERCTLFCDGETIGLNDLPEELFDEGEQSEQLVLPVIENGERGLKDQVKAATAHLERRLIAQALKQTDRNVTRAAQLLKISRKSLQTKMKELGLRVEQ